MSARQAGRGRRHDRRPPAERLRHVVGPSQPAELADRSAAVPSLEFVYRDLESPNSSVAIRKVEPHPACIGRCRDWPGRCAAAQNRRHRKKGSYPGGRDIPLSCSCELIPLDRLSGDRASHGRRAGRTRRSPARRFPDFSSRPPPACAIMLRPLITRCPRRPERAA